MRSLDDSEIKTDLCKEQNSKLHKVHSRGKSVDIIQQIELFTFQPRVFKETEWRRNKQTLLLLFIHRDEHIIFQDDFSLCFVDTHKIFNLKLYREFFNRTNWHLQFSVWSERSCFTDLWRSSVKLHLNLIVYIKLHTDVTESESLSSDQRQRDRDFEDFSCLKQQY